MGVYGLESFVEQNCRDSFYQVDVRELALSFPKKYRQDGEKVVEIPPTIIVDLMAVERALHGRLDVLCGGQGHCYVQQLDIFIKAFKDLGIELLFVKDGASINRKLATRIARKYQRVEDVIYKVFDTLEKKMIPTFIKHHPNGYKQVMTASHVNLPNKVFSRCSINQSTILPNLSTDQLLVQIFKLQVILSGKDKDADQVIAELACNPDLNVVAILSQDTDFMIYQYPKHIYYLSGRHFHFDSLFNDKSTLKTYTYDRINFARWIGLRVEQLPLFATLKGNDLVLPQQLTDFHNKLIGNWPTDKVNAHAAIWAVADFMRKERLPNTSKISQKRIEELAKRIFGDKEKKADLEASIADYLKKPIAAETELNFFEKDENWLKLTSLFPANGPIQKLMLGFPFTTGAYYEDFRNDSIPTLATSFVKLRRRLYGVLFFEKSGALMEPDGDQFVLGVSELCMNGLGSLDKEVIQMIEIPPAYHPGLEALVQEDCLDVLLKVKWKIFTYIVSPDLDSNLLEELNKDYLFPVCQLRVLQHDSQTPILFQWEVQVVLLQYLRLLKMNEEEIKTIQLQFVPSPRGVQIATLVTNGELRLVSDLVKGLIQPVKMLPILYFNGYLFQNLFCQCQQSKSIKDVATDQEILEISHFYDIATSFGVKVRESDPN